MSRTKKRKRAAVILPRRFTATVNVDGREREVQCEQRADGLYALLPADLRDRPLSLMYAEAGT